jgi:hypothetical protein
MSEAPQVPVPEKTHIVRIRESTFRRVWQFRKTMETPSFKYPPIGDVLDKLVSMTLDPLDGGEVHLDPKDTP